jgi:hypothetical protein
MGCKVPEGHNSAHACCRLSLVRRHLRPIRASAMHLMGVLQQIQDPRAAFAPHAYLLAELLHDAEAHLQPKVKRPFFRSAGQGCNNGGAALSSDDDFVPCVCCAYHSGYFLRLIPANSGFPHACIMQNCSLCFADVQIWASVRGQRSCKCCRHAWNPCRSSSRVAGVSFTIQVLFTGSLKTLAM